MVSNGTKNYYVVIAETGWKYHLLKPGDSSMSINVDDPDNFCVYNAGDLTLVNVRWGQVYSDIWRIHNGTYVSINEDDNGKDPFLYRIRSGMGSDPHRCTGRWPACKDGTLKTNSVGLSYPQTLPTTAQSQSSGSIKL
jgi:hypothetical protein